MGKLHFDSIHEEALKLECRSTPLLTTSLAECRKHSCKGLSLRLFDQFTTAAVLARSLIHVRDTFHADMAELVFNGTFTASINSPTGKIWTDDPTVMGDYAEHRCSVSELNAFITNPPIKNSE